MILNSLPSSISVVKLSDNSSSFFGTFSENDDVLGPLPDIRWVIGFVSSGPPLLDLVKSLLFGVLWDVFLVYLLPIKYVFEEFSAGDDEKIARWLVLFDKIFSRDGFPHLIVLLVDDNVDVVDKEEMVEKICFWLFFGNLSFRFGSLFFLYIAGLEAWERYGFKWFVALFLNEKDFQVFWLERLDWWNLSCVMADVFELDVGCPFERS